MKHTWILDNGHGIDTHGKRSPLYDGDKQLLEYEFNRDIVRRIIKLLNEKKIKFINLVPEVEDIKLSERVKRANEIPNGIYLSIHGNAFGDGYVFNKSYGIETYYISKTGEELATQFQNDLVKNTDGKDRGIKTANFYVLKHTKMSAILLELGFYTNKSECEKMTTDNYRNILANSIVESIMEFENEK